MKTASTVAPGTRLDTGSDSRGARANARYRRKRAELIELNGGCCQKCGDTDRLEFAHLAPTGLSGRSRGRNQRVLDVLRHPLCYALLCWRCHRDLDDARPSVQRVRSRPFPELRVAS